MALEPKIPADEIVEQFYGATAELLALSCSPVFAEMLPIVRQSIRDRFDTATTPDGVPWPPRKPSPFDDGHPLLIDTGALFAAALGWGTGAIEQLANRELMVGIDGSVIEYAAVHNEVDDNTFDREYFAPDEQAIDECEELLADYVLEQIFGGE